MKFNVASRGGGGGGLAIKFDFPAGGGSCLYVLGL